MQGEAMPTSCITSFVYHPAPDFGCRCRAYFGAIEEGKEQRKSCLSGHGDDLDS